MSHTKSVVSVLLLAVSVPALLSGCGAAPTLSGSYAKYNAKNGAFACEYPEGWEVKGGGRDLFASAKFSSGSAVIKISADVAGSLMGDIADSFGGGDMGGLGDAAGLDEGGEDISTIAQIHAMGKEDLAEELGNYEEKEATVINTGLGEGRQSEFTASGTFTGSQRGYRVTFLGHNHRVTVVCRCGEKQWATVQPVFDKVIASLQRGVKEV
jgi:hypothetical protein